MALAYLLDPTNQHQNRAGVNNVHGFFKVYLSDTDDAAVTYSDFSGTVNPERIDIDNNGRAVIIADSSKVYRVEMYDQTGNLLYTQYPVWCLATGGGVTPVSVESTDGSIVVDKNTSGGSVEYDLSVNRQHDDAFLDWIKCSWYNLVDGAYVPMYSAGTMSVGAKGVNLAADMLYHVTATVRANKTGERSPFYDNIGVHFSLFDGENTVEVQNFTRIVDHSLGLSQDFTVDADIKVGSLDSQLVVTIDGAESGITFNLMSVEAHRVYSGVPMLPDGVARQDWVNQNFQKKLVAGDNITIDPTTNEISAESQEQADWNQQDYEEPSFIRNKPSLSEVALSGNYNDLINKPSIPAAQVPADWEAQSGVSRILNKPNLSQVATSGSYNDLSDKPTIPAAQVNADWNASSGVAQVLNKPNLAAVATSGNYSDLNGTPTIPTVDQTYDGTSTNAQSGVAVASGISSAVSGKQNTLTAGDGIDITNDVIKWLNTAGITDIQYVQSLPASPDAHTLYLIPET